MALTRSMGCGTDPNEYPGDLEAKGILQKEN